MNKNQDSVGCGSHYQTWKETTTNLSLSIVIIQFLDTVGMFLLTLKMTTTQAVKTSVTNNSLSEDYFHPDDHTRQTTESYVSQKNGVKPGT